MSNPKVKDQEPIEPDAPMEQQLKKLTTEIRQKRRSKERQEKRQGRSSSFDRAEDEQKSETKSEAEEVEISENSDLVAYQNLTPEAAD